MRTEPGLALAYFAGVVCLKSLLLFAAAGCVLFALRKASAAARAMVWQLCLAALLALPLLSIALPPVNVSVPHGSVTRSPIESPAARRMAKPAAVRSEPNSVGAVSPISAEPRVQAGFYEPATRVPLLPRASSKVPIWPALACAWSLGAFLLLARLLLAAFHLRRLSTTSSAAPDWITATAREFESSNRRPVRILVATDRAAKASPMTWGVRRPIILLPAEAVGWSRERLTPVLLHELGHIARYDWPILLLADLAAIVYCFHPLVWLMRRRLRTECELACDDRVLAHGVKPQEYASLLLDIARTNLSRRPISALTLAIAMQSQGGTVLERRLRSVLQAGNCRWPVSRAAAALGMLTLVVTVSPLAAARIAPENTRMPSPVEPFAGVVSQSPSLEADGDDERLSVSYLRHGNVNGSLRASAPSQDVVAAAAAPTADGVAWGKPHSGLVAGLRSTGDRTAWRYGDIIEMDYIVRNVSKEPISFQHEVTPGVAGVISDILDSNGKPARTIGLPVLHTAEVRHVVLDPGSSVLIGKTRMGVLRSGASQKGAAPPASNWVEATPGNYTIRHLDTLDVMGMGARVTNTTFYTGYLPLKIQGPGREDTEVGSKLPVAQPPAEGSAQRVTGNISWGKVINGLRAGLALNNKEAVIGKDIRADLYINNTSKHDVTINYIANDDMFFVPDLCNAKHEKLKFDWRNPTVELKIAGSATLKPGESVCVAHPELNISTWGHNELAEANNFDSVCTHFMSGPGTYHVRMTAALKGAGTTWNYYPAGEVAFALDSRPKDPGTQSAAAAPAEQTGAPDVRQAAEAITWGKSIDGLRAGLAMPGTRANMGKDIRTELYINNTSRHAIKIDYIANDDKFFMPDLWDSKGKKLTPDWRNMTVEQKIEDHAELQPGGTVLIAHPLFSMSSWGHDEEAQANNFDTVCTHYMCGLDKYRVRMTAALMGPGTTWKYYPSGEITFTLAGW